MLFTSKDVLRQKISSGVSLMIGVIFTVPALTGVLPYQYSAPFEWVGVYCLMNGLACLYSPRRILILALAAFLLGMLLDPVIFGGQSFQTSFFANIFVLAFALTGIVTSALIIKFSTIRES